VYFNLTKRFLVVELIQHEGGVKKAGAFSKDTGVVLFFLSPRIRPVGYAKPRNA
jgi:hypothetical protein